MYEISGARFVSTDDAHSVAATLADIAKLIFNAYNDGFSLVSFSVYNDPATKLYNYFISIKDCKYADE